MAGNYNKYLLTFDTHAGFSLTYAVQLYCTKMIFLQKEPHLLCPSPVLAAGVVSAVEAEFDALAAKKDMTRAGEEPRLRVAR